MPNFWRWSRPPRSPCRTKSHIAGTGAATASFSVSAISPAKSKGASCPLPSRRRKASGSDVVELGAALGADHRQHLAPAQRVIAKRAAHPARHHRNAALVYTASGHALMGRLDHHGHPLWLQHLVERVGDLSRHFFLNLQSLGIDFDKPREL